MVGSNVPLEKLLKQLEGLTKASLKLWDIPPNVRISLLNVAENVTYLLETPDSYRSVLRVHREHYHTRKAIDSELAWMDALSAEGNVSTPRYLKGKNGQAVQVMRQAGSDLTRFGVLFEFIDGAAPDESDDITDGYEELGAIAAQCHSHVLSWEKPEGFERLTWDEDSVFGNCPTWGNWRDAPEVTPDIRAILERVEQAICSRLKEYGKSPSRYNLIHADMRLANLLVGDSGTRLIDFDDCGSGWFMYDFAAAISFIEDDPRIPAFKSAWLRGYRSVRILSAADEAELDTFIMMRRMALLAWIGSHIEAPEPQALASGFAATSARLGQKWLSDL